MARSGNKAGSKEVGADQLLGRGSRVLGLASIASAHGQRLGKGPWYVLSKETVGPAEEILLALEQKPDPVVLEAAVRAAMSNKPATAPPGWTKSIIDGRVTIDRIGELIEQREIAMVDPKGGEDASPHMRGLFALAVAFCRSRDTLEALTQSFSKEDREKALQMGALANVVVAPGEPSSIRERLRRFVGLESEVRVG